MTSRSRLLILGATGRLGRVLTECSRSDAEVMLPGRDQIDLARPDDLLQRLRDWSFDTLINAAAITSPDQCEMKPDEAWRVNAEAPGRIAEVCREREARLIHLSTDYVFDGRGCAVLDETHPVQPINVYGRTKLAGEQAVLAACPEALVARVSWLFGPAGGDVPASVIQRARSGQPLDFIEDKWSTPTFTVDLAHWLGVLCREHRTLSGVLHLCNQGVATWRDFAQATLDLACELGLLECRHETTGRHLCDFPEFRAERPRFTPMSSARFAFLTGIQPPTWQHGLERHLRQLAGVAAKEI